MRVSLPLAQDSSTRYTGDMSPAEVLGGVVLILTVLVLLVFFSQANTRHHVPDEEELNFTHEDEVRPDSTDR